MRIPISVKRRTIWAPARTLRLQLRAIRTQREVAELLESTKQSVEITELRALTKVLAAFKSELREA